MIAWLNDGLVIKRWARRSGRKVLYSANSAWGEKEITPADNFEIQAVVKYWWRVPKSRAAELGRATRTAPTHGTSTSRPVDSTETNQPEGITDGERMRRIFERLSPEDRKRFLAELAAKDEFESIQHRRS
mgnify:FL=1